MDEKIMANVDREKLIEWLTHSSGYEILHPDFWLKMGFPFAFLVPYARNHQGGEGKHAIQSRDGQDNAAYGVSEFEIIEGIATAVGAEGGGHMFYGRGKNYQTDVARVLKALR